MPRYPLVFVVLLAACATAVSEDPPVVDAGHVDHEASTSSDAGAVFDVAAADEGSFTEASADAPFESSTNNDASACASSGTLVTFDLTGEPGNQTSTAATSTMSNVTAGTLSRASTITPVSGTNSINGSGWSTGAIDTTRYYTFSITPASPCALDITSVALDTKSSGTGPASGSVATSDDNFSTKTSFTPNSSTSASLSVSGATGAVEIRVYGFGASSTAGTLRIQNTLSVSGSLN